MIKARTTGTSPPWLAIFMDNELDGTSGDTEKISAPATGDGELAGGEAEARADHPGPAHRGGAVLLGGPRPGQE